MNVLYRGWFKSLQGDGKIDLNGEIDLSSRNLIRGSFIIILAAVMMLIAVHPVVPSAVAQTGQTVFAIGAGEHVDSANPYIGIYDISYVYYGLIWNSMTTIAADLSIRPNLAESWWSMDGETASTLSEPTDFSADVFGGHNDPSDWPLGSIWEYNITENVFWNDGTAFTAYDVEWTINIQIGPNWMIYWAYQPYTAWIHYAEAINSHKVRVYFSHLDSREPLAVAWGESLFIPIMPKHFFQGLPDTYIAYTWQGFPPIGTGPFMGTSALEDELKQKEKITLVRNPYFNFIDPADGQRKGLGAAYNFTTEIDKIFLKFFSEEATLSLAVRTGEVDTAKLQTPTYLQWLEDPSIPETVQLSSILTSTGYSKQICINPYEDAPGTLSVLRLDPALHRAAALAIDKGLIINQVYKGLADEGVGLISPVWSDWWWEPGNELSTFNVTDGDGDVIYSYTEPMNDIMDFNIERANEILNKAGYIWTGTPGTSVREATLLVGERLQQMGVIANPSAVVGKELDFEMVIDSTVYDDLRIAQNVIPNWEKIGIHITTEIVGAAQWSKLIYEYTYNTMITYWSGDVDPNYISFVPTSWALFGWNEFGTADPYYDQLYMNQASALNYEERKAWVDECTKWQYLSGTIVTPIYPHICFAYNEKRWTNWGNWTEYPGQAVDHFWGGNSLFYDLQYVGPPPDDDDGDDNTMLVIAIIAGIAAAGIAGVITMKIMKKKREEKMLMEDDETEKKPI